MARLARVVGLVARGAEEQARWLAFKRYLQNLEKYTKVEEATDIFSQYLPYAVAFGLEQSFIRKFEKVEAPPPTWWIPYGYPRPYYEGSDWSGGGGTRSTRGGPVIGGGGMSGGFPGGEGGVFILAEFVVSASVSNRTGRVLRSPPSAVPLKVSLPVSYTHLTLPTIYFV